MKQTFDEDYPCRFSYELRASINYPYPFENIPQEGLIEISQKDELREFEWKRAILWADFWQAVAARIEYDPVGQFGFGGWPDSQPSMGYDEKIGSMDVEIDVRIPYKHKFEDEIDLAEVCLVLEFDKKTGELRDWRA